VSHSPLPVITPITKTDKVIPGYHLIQAVIDVAVPRGASKDKILRGTGIFEDSLTPETLISAKQCIALLTNVSGQCKGHDVSFLIGKSLGGAWLAENIEQVKYCQRLEQGIEVLRRIRWACFPLVSFKRFDVEDNVMWVLQDPMGSQKCWPFITQLYLSMLVALVKYWTGSRLPISFAMDSSRPRNIEDFETYLGLRMTFNAPLLSIMVPKTCLNTAFPHANGQAFQQCLLSSLEKSPPATLSLLDVIRTQTLREPQKGLADVAQRLSCSTATLKRKLNEHHYSYRSLTEEARRQQAIVLLALQKLNNEQSASKMAFSDLTNFRRAVKRLTGLTPSELRAR